MIKIWVKTVTELKITKDLVFESRQSLGYESFFEIVREICGSMDTPTPLILGSHINSFKNFGRCKFRRSDFVEKVPFDELILEDITDK